MGETVAEELGTCDVLEQVDKRLNNVEQNLRAFRMETREEFGAVRNEMREDSVSVRSEMQDGFTLVRGEIA